MAEAHPLKEEREAVTELGQEMLSRGLTGGTGGNVSVRRGDRIAISPSGVPYEDVTPDTVPIVDLDGWRLEGELAPSNETPLHTILYDQRPDVGGIVHTHSPYASTFASLNKSVPASYYLIAKIGTEIPVAGYEPPGTEALGQEAAETMGDEYDAVLLENHGVVSVGADGADAFDVAQTVESCARIHYQALNVGTPDILDDRTVEDLRKMFEEDYGQ